MGERVTWGRLVPFLESVDHLLNSTSRERDQDYAEADALLVVRDGRAAPVIHLHHYTPDNRDGGALKCTDRSCCPRDEIAGFAPGLWWNQAVPATETFEQRLERIERRRLGKRERLRQRQMREALRMAEVFASLT